MAARTKTRRGQQPSTKRPQWLLPLGLAAILAVGTFVTYSSISNDGFIANYDDYHYVVQNAHVNSGLTLANLRWALTATEQSNWHPVTWISHQLDCELFGLDAGDHHLTNLVIHILNVLLLFLLLLRFFGAPARSFVVAGLFAWHPFNVGSVAWIAERKNLLSTFFLFLTVAAYVWYVRRPDRVRHLAVVGMFILALVSKPIVVTLPFVLLLLDYWPLRRMSSSNASFDFQRFKRLAIEKWPLFLLSIASCVITVYAQRMGRAVKTLQSFPFSARLANALVSYLQYLEKTFWPFGFALYYPHPGVSLAWWKPVVAVVILSAITVAAFHQRSRRPYLLVGWLWFLGTLVPVIGLVQVGDQAMADRYAYLPLIGIFVAITWGAADLYRRFLKPKATAWIVASLVLATLAFLSYRENRYWQSGVSVWNHAFEVSNGNVAVEKLLASALLLQHDSDGAERHLTHIAQTDPADATVHSMLGSIYGASGRIQEATRELEASVRLSDNKQLGKEEINARATAQLNLGFAYGESQEYARAIRSLNGARQTKPAMFDSMIESLKRSLASSPTEGNVMRLTLLLRAKGEDQAASSLLQNAIAARPEYNKSRELLTYLRTPPE